MKNMFRAFLAAIIAIGILQLDPATAQAVPPSDCAFSHYHSSLTYYNGLAWSSSDRNAWHTPMYRAGACGKVYIEFLGVYNAPSCAYIKLVTYHENRARNWEGPWYLFEGVGDLGNIRGSGYINNGRLYRVYAYGCGRFRHMNFPPGFMIYTHAV